MLRTSLLPVSNKEMIYNFFYPLSLFWKLAFVRPPLAKASRHNVKDFSVLSSSVVFSASFVFNVSTLCCHFFPSSHFKTSSFTFWLYQKKDNRLEAPMPTSQSSSSHLKFAIRLVKTVTILLNLSDFKQRTSMGQRYFVSNKPFFKPWPGEKCLTTNTSVILYR